MPTRATTIKLLLPTALGALPLRAGAQTPTPVRVGASVDDGLTPLLYAMHAGWFTAAGLDVTLQGANSGAALASAIAGGAVDVAKSSMMSLITGQARGVSFKIVCGGPVYVPSAPTTEICVLAGGPIKSLADVRGKTAAIIALKSLEELSVRAVVDQHGGDSASCRFIEMPQSAMLIALEQGRADLASMTNPILAAARQSGNVRTLIDPYDALGSGAPIGVWFCSGEFATKNPSVVRRFAEVMYRAGAYGNGHHDETVPLLAAYTHIDEAAIRAMNRNVYATTLGPNAIQPLVDAAARYKFIDAPFPARELFP